MKKYVLCGGAALAALVCGAPVVAQDQPPVPITDDEFPELRGDVRSETPPILVTASRAPSTYQGNFTGSVSVLTEQDLRQRQVRDIADALRDVPGVAVSSVAGQTQIRLRGSEANHVLVLVDGIEVSDPFAGEFDTGTLQAEIASRVEIIRGPQSALYGTDSIGGVIAYQSGRFKGLGGLVEGGTNGTFNAAARLGDFGLGWDASLSATLVSTDGQPNARNGTRDIGRDSYTISGKGSLTVAPGLAVRGGARFIRTEGEFNDQDFNPLSPTFGLVIDSPDTRFENEAIYALLGASVDALDGAWTHDLSGQIADITRDTFGPFGPSNSSKGERLKASYVTAYTFLDRQSLTFAADWERERFQNTTPGGFAFNGQREIENVGLVGEYRVSEGAFDASAAIRHDINDRFADATTFRIGAGYAIADKTRLRASIGSGIKNPGFFELFGFVDGSFIGNEDLTPEKSTGWEVGIDQQFGSARGRLSVTYFNARLEDEIFTTFPAPTFIATPANRDTVSKQQGVELAVNAVLGGGFTLDGAYTFLDAEEDGVEEVRRPDHIASASLNWRDRRDRASANVTVRYNGQAEDLAFTDPSFIPVRVTLEDYVLVNLNARVKLAEGINAFGRVENLLDEQYEQVFSFVSPGRSAVVGIEARF